MEIIWRYRDFALITYNTRPGVKSYLVLFQGGFVSRELVYIEGSRARKRLLKLLVVAEKRRPELLEEICRERIAYVARYLEQRKVSLRRLGLKLEGKL
jgi:septum formation topological specificity factor MinE